MVTKVPAASTAGHKAAHRAGGATSGNSKELSPTQAAAQVAGVPANQADKPLRWWERRSAKVIAMVLVVAIAVIVVMRSTKPEEFKQAFEHMNPWWFLASFAAGTLTWVGAAITMKVFAPVPIQFRRAVLVQVASSFVGVVAPAGLGSLALGIRFLVKEKMETAQAVATMILMELSQFLTSFVLVIAAIVFVGVDPHVKISWKVIAWVAGAIVVVAGAAFAVKKSRDWVIQEVKSVWSRAYPEAAWAFKHPRQLAFAILGALLQTTSFAASFMFALMAFGHPTGFFKVAAAYLVANTLGSMIPVPGGVGSVEASLTVGLTAVGIPAAVALSAAVTFRLATFYAQIPIGWVAFEYMQRKEMI